MTGWIGTSQHHPTWGTRMSRWEGWQDGRGGWSEIGWIDGRMEEWKDGWDGWDGWDGMGWDKMSGER